MDTKDIQAMITRELATKVINTLPDEQKNLIIAEAVKDILTKELKHSAWDIQKMLKEYAMAHAFEYAQSEEVQTKLKEQAHQAVGNILDGMVQLIGKAIENDIKSNYARILSEKRYGE